MLTPPALKNLASGFLSRLAASQAANGWLPGLKTNLWFSDSLMVAHRALGSSNSTTIFNLLKNYEEHLGSYLMPSIGPGKPGTVDGPTSLWTLMLLEQGTGNPQYLEVAAKTPLAQALSVYPDNWGPRPHDSGDGAGVVAG